MMGRGRGGYELQEDGRGLILMVEHLGTRWTWGVFPCGPLETRGHHDEKFAWRKGVWASVCCSAGVSEGGVPSCW